MKSQTQLHRVNFVSAPDGAALTRRFSGQRKLTWERFSVILAARMPRISRCRSCAGHFVVSTPCGYEHSTRIAERNHGNRSGVRLLYPNPVFMLPV